MNRADNLHLREIGLQIDAEAKEKGISLTTMSTGVDPEELKTYAITRTLNGLAEFAVSPGTVPDIHALIAACWLDGFAVGHRMKERYGA